MNRGVYGRTREIDLVGSAPPPPITGVSISPTSAAIQLAATQQFSATVTGGSTGAVTWSVNGTPGGDSTTGTISSSGLYTPPAAVSRTTTVTVTATSQEDTTKSASADVTMISAVRVQVSPLAGSLTIPGWYIPGGLNLEPYGISVGSLTVSGTSNTAVTGSVNGVVGGDSQVGTLVPIPNSVQYVTPSQGVRPPGINLTFVAASAADPSQSAVSFQQLIPHPVLVVATSAGANLFATSPVCIAVPAGQTQQFYALTGGQLSGGYGPTATVTWSVNGLAGGSNKVGTIAAGTDSSGAPIGLYTAPSTVPSPSTVKVTAKSTMNTTVSSSPNVTIVQPSVVTVTACGGDQQISVDDGTSFSAAVTGTSNSAVTWSVNAVARGDSTVGTIDTDGNYTPPTLVPSPSTVTVAATSEADPLKSASLPLTVMGSLVIQPHALTYVPVGQTEQFSVGNFAGYSNQAVSWAINGISGGNSTVGTISSTGEYAAPSTVPSPDTVTVAATSQADPSVSDSITFTITSAATSVTLSPKSASVQPGASQQFSADVTGANSNALCWAVDNLGGGNATVGTISSAGLYMAPASPVAGLVTISAYDDFGSSCEGGFGSPSNLNPGDEATLAIMSLSGASGASRQDLASETLRVGQRGQAQDSNSTRQNASLSIVAVHRGRTAGGLGAALVQGSSESLFIVGRGLMPGTTYEVLGSGDVVFGQPSDK